MYICRVYSVDLIWDQWLNINRNFFKSSLLFLKFFLICLSLLFFKKLLKMMGILLGQMQKVGGKYEMNSLTCSGLNLLTIKSLFLV